MFQYPKRNLGQLDADSAAALIAAAADVAVVLDKKGVVRDVSVNRDQIKLDNCEAWLGQQWTDTVTEESRFKIEELLKGANNDTGTNWRQVTVLVEKGEDLPVLFSTIHVGDKGRVVAMGRNLEAVTKLQRRLMDAQRSMEREYARLRHAETRYRLLFENASEAVVIIDAVSMRVSELNPAAEQVLSRVAKRPIGRSFLDMFSADDAERVGEVLTAARSGQRAPEVEVVIGKDGGKYAIGASLFRQDGSSSFLMRLTAAFNQAHEQRLPQTANAALSVVESIPEAFVVTNGDGRIVTANAAFLELAQLPSLAASQDQHLERFFGRAGVDFNVLLANLREHGSLRMFSTTLAGAQGAQADVEISAVSVESADPEILGFVIRDMTGRLSASQAQGGRELPKSIAQMTELVGRVPLKDLVRETTDIIERLCIEAALQLTGDNRASAAEMLGLSRQSLYVKLRRYGISDLGAEN
ncbi:MAG: transcriptional regulator PpsR [Pseudomonadota bacterium]